MIKSFTKILALLLVSIMLASSLVSCNKDDTPEGYQLIACEGDQFRLYVPTQGWMPNTAGGVTSAFFSQAENTSVSVYKADDAGERSLEEYWTYCSEKYASELDEYSFIGSEKCILGGQAARKYIFTAKNYYLDNENAWSRITYKFMQVMAKYNGDTYILVYSAPEDYYDSHASEIEGDENGAGVIPYFTFAEPYVSDEKKEYSDKVVAPAGMKLISTDECAYRFFVPVEWQVNERAELSAAYYSDSDRSNVSVQLYICGTGDEVQSVESYFERCQESYTALFESCELISDKQITMSESDARMLELAITTGGVEYKMLQAIVQRGDAIYCLTYTALAENYESHISDAWKMIESFEIR